jgi:hypothetical protein
MMEQKRRGRRPRIEGALNEVFTEKYPEAKSVGGPLSGIIEQFKTVHPELWESIRLCPLQHGLDVMVETLERA